MQRLMNISPGRPLGVALGLLPFILLVLVYLSASSMRLAENPADKLLPAFSSMGNAIERLAFEPSRRTGEYVFWQDTAASLKRLGIGVAISALIGLVVGSLNGLIPLFRAKMSPLVTVLSMVPPLALLPILFIIFGLGEVSKVALIVFGVAPFLVRDLQQRTQSMPLEQIVKAQTLGAGTWLTLVRIVLPQLMPRLIDAVRLSMGAAWLFLIAAEAIASTEGLGYRVFLVRRYMSMDIILPYVVWITFLAYVLDACLQQLSRKMYPWYHAEQKVR